MKESPRQTAMPELQQVRVIAGVESVKNKRYWFAAAELVAPPFRRTFFTVQLFMSAMKSSFSEGQAIP